MSIGFWVIYSQLLVEYSHIYEANISSYPAISTTYKNMAIGTGSATPRSNFGEMSFLLEDGTKSRKTNLKPRRIKMAKSPKRKPRIQFWSTEDDEIIIINECTIGRTIMKYVHQEGNSYLDELPGLYIVHCLVHRRKHERDAQSRWKFLRSKFPFMDLETMDTFVYMTEGMTKEHYLKLICFHWHLFLGLVRLAKELNKPSPMEFLKECDIDLLRGNFILDRSKAHQVIEAHRSEIEKEPKMSIQKQPQKPVTGCLLELQNIRKALSANDLSFWYPCSDICAGDDEKGEN